MFHLCAGPTGVFVKVFRLVRGVGQCLTGCSVGVLSLLVRRAWSLLLNAITPLKAVCTSEGLELQSTSPHLLFFLPCLTFILPFLPSFSCSCPIHTPRFVFSSNVSMRIASTCSSKSLMFGQILKYLKSQDVSLTYLLHISPGLVSSLCLYAYSQD